MRMHIISDCKHEWWSWCHDAKITSLSRNYYFPNIILAVGGRIFSIWNIKYKVKNVDFLCFNCIITYCKNYKINLFQQGGPIWWRQYAKEDTLTQGCFTPFHPGVFYIGKANGRVDLWNVRKQIHEPVLEMRASGYSITRKILNKIMKFFTKTFASHIYFAIQYEILRKYQTSSTIQFSNCIFYHTRKLNNWVMKSQRLDILNRHHDKKKVETTRNARIPILFQ